MRNVGISGHQATGSVAGDVMARYLALGDLSSTVSDALDTLGIGRTVGAGDLPALTEDQRICGPAVTLRYLPEDGDASALSGRGEPSRLGDREAFAAAPHGAVAVLDAGGRCEAAALGGIGATVAVRAGLAGIVVDGSVRDTTTLLALGIPVWCRGRSPLSGRHRLATVEVGGVVGMAGVQVRPGDLIVGDSTGLCVVPAERAAEVVQRCEDIERDEAEVLARLGGSPD
jgi:regulator of RNase E activity RraA